MTKTLVSRPLSVVMMLTVGLFLGLALCHPVNRTTDYRHDHLLYTVEDDAISGKGVMNCAGQQQALAVGEQIGAAVVHPSVPPMRAQEIKFSRLVSTALTLHFVYTQTTSSAT